MRKFFTALAISVMLFTAAPVAAQAQTQQVTAAAAGPVVPCSGNTSWWSLIWWGAFSNRYWWQCRIF